MAKNDFNIRRTAYGRVTLAAGSASSVHSTGMYIPAGAIITGIRWVAPGVVTLTNASGTIVPRVGTDNLCVTVNQSDLGAQTVVVTTAVVQSYVTNGGELQIVEGVSNTSTAGGTYEYYVDYIYVNE